MANKKSNGLLTNMVMGALLAVSTSGAMAAWNFDFETATVSGNTSIVTNANGKATATAFSVTNATSTAGGQTIGQFDSATTFASATLGANPGAGLGVLSGGESGSPNHAMDNKDRTDMILFGFSSKVELDAVTIGWAQTSSYSCGTTQKPLTCAADTKPDISVLYYTGSSAMPIIGGLSWTQLSADGWKLVSNYADLTVDVAKPVNSANNVSSWWLVSAFNTGFGGTANGGTLNDDYFKLASLTVSAPPPTTTKVPEPGSLALMGAALIGLLGMRRRTVRRR